MDVFPDLTAVTPLAAYAAANDSDSADIAALAQQAEQFLRGFSWVSKIVEQHVGAIYPGIIGIFLFRIESPRDDVDDWTWVIVGDVPPAYITCEDAVVPREALDGYIGALEKWVAAAKTGSPVDRLIPVNAEPTEENATALEGRLKFLDQRIMPLLGAPA